MHDFLYSGLLSIANVSPHSFFLFLFSSELLWESLCICSLAIFSSPIIWAAGISSNYCNSFSLILGGLFLFLKSWFSELFRSVLTILPRESGLVISPSDCSGCNWSVVVKVTSKLWRRISKHFGENISNLFFTTSSGKFLFGWMDDFLWAPSFLSIGGVGSGI